MEVRIVNGSDLTKIRDVYMSAFPAVERESVTRLVLDLLVEITAYPIISLVVEHEGELIGHVSLSPVSIEGVDGCQGYILAPLAVRSDYQKQGVGSSLIRNGINRLAESGVSILLVYGDPNYYGRFGFSTEFAEAYIPPYKLQYPFGWQGMPLGACNTPATPVKVTCVKALCDPGLW